MFSFPSSQIQQVKIKTENGSIESSTWDDDSIHVVFKKSATGDDEEEAMNNIDSIKIEIVEDTTSGILSIDVSIPESAVIDYGCNVSVNLPASISLSLDSSNGPIKVSGSQNGLECSTSNGGITIEDTKGDARLRTSNGAIIVKDHQGELDGRTSNDKVDVDIVLPNQGKCILKTSNESITLSIPDITSAQISASTSNGEVKIKEFDITTTKMEKTELNGKIGDGEGTIELETTNGDIVIQRKP